MEINDLSQLEALYGETSQRARRKVMPALDVHCRNFIALSPFLLIGSASADGRADVSPKGDAPGFVKVVDDKTLLIPDRQQPPGWHEKHPRKSSGRVDFHDSGRE